MPVRSRISRSGPRYAPASAMSGTWTGSRVTAMRPMLPSTAANRGAPGHLDHLRVEVVGRAEVELLGPLVVLVDGAAIRAGELDGAGDDGGEHGLEVERGADGLADLAERVSSSTERVSSAVRACSSVSRRAFSMAMAAWSAKVSSSSI